MNKREGKVSDIGFDYVELAYRGDFKIKRYIVKYILILISINMNVSTYFG